MINVLAPPLPPLTLLMVTEALARCMLTTLLPPEAVASPEALAATIVPLSASYEVEGSGVLVIVGVLVGVFVGPPGVGVGPPPPFLPASLRAAAFSAAEPPAPARFNW